MTNLNIVDVFAVYGDFGNIGNGCLIGVFDNKDMAESAAKDRGSLDCGGNGHIENRKGIKDEDTIYLIESCSLVNSIIKPLEPESKIFYYNILVTNIIDPVKFLWTLRSRTGADLSTAKQFRNKFRRLGKLKVDKIVSSDEFADWKKELKNIAVIEAVPIKEK
jgi:hypothetical protein